MTTITVQSIETKPKRSVVITTEGRRLGCWTDKLDKFNIQVGSAYEVETEESDFNGKTLTNIVKAKQIGASPSPSNGGGGNHYRATLPEDAERMFVCATLTALIKAGEVKNDKVQLYHTTNMLRLLYQHTFGGALPAEQQRAA